MRDKQAGLVNWHERSGKGLIVTFSLTFKDAAIKGAPGV